MLMEEILLLKFLTFKVKLLLLTNFTLFTYLLMYWYPGRGCYACGPEFIDEFPAPEDGILFGLLFEELLDAGFKGPSFSN